ncbi:precorrin-8X methylmutase [Anaerotignum sp.]
MLNQKHSQPADIEKTSMAIIEAELQEKGIVLPEENAAVVKRVIHTTADFEYVENLYFSKGAVKMTAKALKENAVIVTDTNMAKAGISKVALQKLDGAVYCFMADDEVAAKAKETGSTRAAASMEKSAELYPAAVFAVGNAPTALLKLCELMENGLRPALVIGVPVGFVNVVDSKERLIEICEKYSVPVIVARGRKGGSNIAAAVCNALLYTAADMLDPVARGW